MPRPFRWNYCHASSGFASSPPQFEATARRQARQAPGTLVGQGNDDFVKPCRFGRGSCWGLESQFTPTTVRHGAQGGMVVLFHSSTGRFGMPAEENCWRNCYLRVGCSPDHVGTV